MKKFLLLVPLALFLGTFYLLLNPKGVLSQNSVPETCPSSISDPASSPDYNIGLLTSKPVGYGTGPCQPASGGLIACGGDTDSRAPQFSTLLAGNARPRISSLYSVDPGSRYAATQIGLAATSGQQVLVPSSGYNIGSGYSAMVVYATQNSVVLKYTREDNVADGYTIFINGINTNSSVLQSYQAAHNAGRTELPALRSGQVVGSAAGGEVRLAVRDKGTFLDPRSEKDWWASNNSAGASPGGPGVIDPFCGGQSTTPLPRQPNEDPADACSASNAPKGTFRPFPCYNCQLSLPSGELAYGRISTVSVFNDIRVSVNQIKKVDACPEYYATVTWGGTLQLDTDETTVPFAGFRDSDKTADSLVKYISDYYDGTHLYDGISPDMTDPDQAREAFNNGGVFRKLAPQELQDNLRKQMIFRVRDRTDSVPPNNYELKLDNETLHISDYYPEERIKPLRKDFPATQLGENEYQIALTAWYGLDGGKWAKFWPTIPMAMREDVPGQMFLNVQGPPGKLEVVPKGGNTAKITFPHLGRLNDIIGMVRNIFSPGITSFNSSFIGQIINKVNPFTKNQTETLANASPTGIGEVLADQDIEACPFDAAIQPVISGGGGSYRGCFNIVPRYLGPDLPPEGSWGTDWGYTTNVYVNGKLAGSRYSSQGSGRFIYNSARQWESCSDKTGVVDFSAPPGSEVTFEVGFSGGQFNTFNGRNRDCSSEINNSVSLSRRTCKIGADGKPDLSTCTVAPPIPPPIVCGNNFVYSPGSVENDKALEDDNPDLDVVCTNPDPVTAKITVTDDQIPISEEAYQEAQENGFIYVRASREVGIGVLIPHLNQIWESALGIGQTRISDQLGNLANADLEARSPVKFIFRPDFGQGGANPGDGFLYYPHLGGVQCGKLMEIASAEPDNVIPAWLRVELEGQCGVIFEPQL